MRKGARKSITPRSRADLLEKLSELEHNQWVFYSKSVANTIRSVRSIDDLDKTIIKWHKNWVPYSQLSEKEKDKDRIWARKALGIIRRIEKSRPI
jgi:hypothetical protein